MSVPAKYPPERPANGSNLQTAMIAITLVVAGFIVVVTRSTAGLTDLGTLLVAVAILINQSRRR